MGTMNDKLDTLTQQTESNTKKLENVQSEVTKINIKIENNIEPNIKLIAEGQHPLSQIAKDVEHILEDDIRSQIEKKK